MVIRRADKNTEAGVLQTTELVDALLKYHKQMEDAGILVRRLKDGVSKK
jgi:hypothetical protein